MFVRRAGKFMRALVASVNQENYTPIAAIENPVVAAENADDLQRTVDIMGQMGYMDVQTDENGNQSLRLTEAGTKAFGIFAEEGGL